MGTFIRNVDLPEDKACARLTPEIVVVWCGGVIVPPDLEKLGHGWCLSQCQGFVRLFGTNSGGCINKS